jgi:sigma-B regulation protein RsbU (phosphoserine phosphatase)
MQGFKSSRKPVLVLAALVFAACTIFYSSLWALYSEQTVPVELGFDNKYLPLAHSQLVRSVVPGSPAERAGIKAGDRIVRINGVLLQEDSLVRVWIQHKPGDSVDLTVERRDASRPGAFVALDIQATFRASEAASAEVGVAQHLGQGVLRLYPFAFLTVGLAVLFLRLEDPNAWLLALMFGGFIAIPAFDNDFFGVPASLRSFAIAFRTIFDNMVAALFYFFFAVFPTRSPLERRLPWLKWAALVLGLFLALPLGMALAMPEWISRDAPRSAALGWVARGYPHYLILSFNYGLVALGFVSLTWNAATVHSSEARRKIRVILFGTLVGVVPATLVLAAGDFFGFHIGLWLGASVTLVLWLFPLSFAYAVVKHRVLEIPVLLKRSARFLMVQWGIHILGLIATVTLILILGRAFSKQISAHPQVSMIPAFGLGGALLWLGIVVGERVKKRIDHAFFRSAYDARLILENLAEKTRTAGSRDELATLLQEEIKQALHPQTMVMYQSAGNGKLFALATDTQQEPQTIPADLPLLLDLARRGQPWEVPSGDSILAPELSASLRTFAPLQPECLVPMPGRENKLAGLLLLGARRSEEPYSREDRRLLASVASQAGVALESIALTERMAERVEAERRSLHELEMARQVQARLFPQKFPELRTLEYAGRCIQARQVGGDYYDFLELAPGRVGFVLADIAGKGFSGALLMANLQANLRSQYAMAVDDLPRLLASVNHLFYESTGDASYATLLFADYDDSNGKLRFANCGHLPALLLRGGEISQHTISAASNLERLSSTCTVMGLFESWQCEIAEVELAAGDTLVLYTDGVTEATNGDGEEFGESHLVEALTNHSHLPLESLLEAVIGAVQKFSSGSEQQDDITLVVARCRS